MLRKRFNSSILITPKKSVKEVNTSKNPKRRSQILKPAVRERKAVTPEPITKTRKTYLISATGPMYRQIREKFTSKIGNWIGFWYGSLEKSNLSWGSIFFDSNYPQTNVGDHNIVLYPLNDRVGIGFVDLDKSHENPSERVKDFELDSIKKELAFFDGIL